MSFSVFGNRYGVTLVELMAVTVVMGLLAAASVPLGEMVYEKAREQQVEESVAQVRRALDWYYEDHGYYPSVTAGATARDALNILVQEGYIRQLPVNPYTNRPDDWEIRDSTGSSWIMVGDEGDYNPGDSIASVSGPVRSHRVTDVMDIRFPRGYDISDPGGRPLSTY